MILRISSLDLSIDWWLASFISPLHEAQHTRISELRMSLDDTNETSIETWMFLRPSSDKVTTSQGRLLASTSTCLVVRQRAAPFTISSTYNSSMSLYSCVILFQFTMRTVDCRQDSLAQAFITVSFFTQFVKWTVGGLTPGGSVDSKVCIYCQLCSSPISCQ